MSIKMKFIQWGSLYNHWGKQEQVEWLELFNLSFVNFYFRKNFYIYGILMLTGMQIATWINYTKSPLQYDWTAAIFWHTVLPLAASFLYAVLARKFTHISYENSTIYKTKEI